MRRLQVALVLLVFSACALAQTEKSSRSDSVIARYIKGENINISHNNSLVLLTSGKEKFKDMFAAIEKARHSVHLEYFNFRNDSIAGALFELLERKASEGVEVRVLYDAFGNASNSKPIKKDKLRKGIGDLRILSHTVSMDRLRPASRPQEDSCH